MKQVQEEDNTLKLNDSMVRKAKQLSRKAQGAKNPFVFVDDWYALPQRAVEWNEEQGEDIIKVPVDKIIGTCPQNINRFQSMRFQNVLKTLAMGDWKTDRPGSELPQLQKVGDFWYVGADGNHRALAFKAMGIEYLTARVTYYDIVHESGIPHKHLRGVE